MAFERLPETTQTLYAELLEQTIHAEAESAMAGAAAHGTFVSKSIKGGTYWYLQRQEGDRKRQHYLGKESPELLAWMEEVRQLRGRTAADEAQRTRLSSMLAAGRAATESAATGKVLQLLADSGVFRMGGVLVGTQAFAVYGNMLGVRFDRQQDTELVIQIVFSQEPVELEKPLTGLSSTSFKIRGREVKVDFLAPLEPSLDYLIEDPVQAVVVSGPGILVNVPSPARFAFHKLWISRRRPVSEQAKAVKDLRQGASVLEVLLEDRPGDVTAAWEALLGHGSAVEAVREALEKAGEAWPQARNFAATIRGAGSALNCRGESRVCCVETPGI